MEWDQIDRRRLVRTQMPFTLHLELKGKKSISTYSEDISEEGIKVVIREKIEVGSNLGVAVFISKSPLRCQGEVIWVKEKKRQRVEKVRFYEAGIKLNGLSQQDLITIKKSLKKKDK